MAVHMKQVSNDMETQALTSSWLQADRIINWNKFKKPGSIYSNVILYKVLSKLLNYLISSRARLRNDSTAGGSDVRASKLKTIAKYLHRRYDVCDLKMKLQI